MRPPRKNPEAISQHQRSLQGRAGTYSDEVLAFRTKVGKFRMEEALVDYISPGQSNPASCPKLNSASARANRGVCFAAQSIAMLDAAVFLMTLKSWVPQFF